MIKILRELFPIAVFGLTLAACILAWYNFSDCCNEKCEPCHVETNFDSLSNVWQLRIDTLTHMRDSLVNVRNSGDRP